MMGAMRIDWLPLLVVFLILAIVIGGTLIGLYALYTRLLALLEKHEQ
jgi:hypothetical protein